MTISTIMSLPLLCIGKLDEWYDVGKLIHFSDVPIIFINLQRVAILIQKRISPIVNSNMDV